jgi:AcrR family transcriptional regulator
METAESGRGGRPRSEAARDAVLHAVDDLLMEIGYAAMTMKGIAERAGVGRQTVYRWWSTKAEILFEACVADARDELAVASTGNLTRDLNAYVAALVQFLARSPAGAAYRALVGEAQHDHEVAALISTQDLLGISARAVLEPYVGSDRRTRSARALEAAVAQLIGPVLYWMFSGRSPETVPRAAIVDAVVSTLAPSPGR